MSSAWGWRGPRGDSAGTHTDVPPMPSCIPRTVSSRTRRARQMSFAGQVIANIDWDSYEVCAQSGADFGFDT